MRQMTKRRVLFLGFLGTCLGVVSSAGIMRVADAGPECLRAAGWVKARGGDLPRSLAGIAAFPVSYRRAIFSTLSSEEKAALFHEQVRKALDTDLTEGQRAFVLRILPNINAGLFADERPEWLPKATEEMKKLFGREKAAALFATLGEPGDGNMAASSAAFMVGLRERSIKTATRTFVTSAMIPMCDCAITSDWCWGNCEARVCKIPENNNCGTFWSYDCTGVCN